MNIQSFCLWFGMLSSLWFAQAMAAWRDGYLTQTQMRHHGVTEGWSISEHGGWWADFYVTLLIAYLTGKYSFNYFSRAGVEILAASLIFWAVLAIFVYAPMGRKNPEAFAHSGVRLGIPLAGWLHVVYAGISSWVCLMVVFPHMTTTKPISVPDILITSVVLTPWAYYGVVKFNKRWVFDTMARWQVAVEIVLIWLLAYLRICWW